MQIAEVTGFSAARKATTPPKQAPPPTLLPLGRSSFIFCVAEQGLDESFGVEFLQVLGTLAEADVADGDFELVANGEDDAALGGSVELREDDPGEVDRILEHLRLRERVLSGGR